MATIYTTGGTVRPDSPGYIERRADSELFEALKAGEYCYVLDSRQKGKSSLMARCQLKLEAAGVRTVQLDLQRFGSNLDAERWYAGILDALGDGLDLHQEAFNFWGENLRLGPLQRLFGAIERVFLAGGTPFAIFIDEIDFVRSLPFSTDEFFAAIRECYNRRSSSPEFTKLKFCLLGVATPSELISDGRVTPFNIGKRIELTDFTLEEALPLASDLGENGNLLLIRIHYWTNGHPYLTQAICEEVSRTHDPVDEVVRRRYLDERARETDSNLADVGNRILGKGDPGVDEAARSDVLSTLLTLLKSGVPDDESNPSTARVKMSGVARLEGGRLTVRNRIYAKAFDKAWVRENMPGQELRRQKRAYWLGVFRTGTIMTCAVSIFLWLALSNMALSRKALLLARESDQRRLAAEDQSYAASMNYMATCYQQGNLAQMRDLLAQTRENRLRGWEWSYWNRVANSQLAETSPVKGEQFPVFSPDGKIVACRGTLGVRFLDSGSLKELWRIPPMSPWNQDCYVLWLPDGKRIVDVDNELRIVRIRDAKTGDTLQSIPGEDYGYRQSLSPDGYEICVEALDGSGVRVVDLVHRSSRFIHGTDRCVISPDGTLIASMQLGTSKVPSQVVIRDRRTLKIRTQSPHGSWPRLLFSSDSKSLFVGELNGTIACLSSATLRPRWTQVADDSPPNITSASRDGKWLCGFGRSGRGYLIPLSPGGPGPVRKFPTLIWPQISPDGSTIVAGELDRLALYSLANPSEDSKSKSFASFADDGSVIQSTNQGFCVFYINPIIHRVDTTNNIVSKSYTMRRGSIVGVDQNRSRALVQNAGRLDLREFDSGKTLLSFPHAPISEAEVVTLSDPDKVAMGLGTDRLDVWSISKGRQIWSLSARGATVKLAEDRGLLAACSSDGAVRVWDEKSRKLLWQSQAGPDVLSISPDGKWVAANDQADILVFAASTGKLCVRLRGHNRSAEDLGFSPDGKRIVTCSRDTTVRIWDAVTGRQLTLLPDAGSDPYFCRFVHGGKDIVTVDFLGFVRTYSTAP